MKAQPATDNFKNTFKLCISPDSCVCWARGTLTSNYSCHQRHSEGQVSESGSLGRHETKTEEIYCQTSFTKIILNILATAIPDTIIFPKRLQQPVQTWKRQILQVFWSQVDCFYKNLYIMQYVYTQTEISYVEHMYTFTPLLRRRGRRINTEQILPKAKKRIKA